MDLVHGDEQKICMRCLFWTAPEQCPEPLLVGFFWNIRIFLEIMVTIIHDGNAVLNQAGMIILGLNTAR